MKKYDFFFTCLFTAGMQKVKHVLSVNLYHCLKKNHFSFNRSQFKVQGLIQEQRKFALSWETWTKSLIISPTNPFLSPSLQIVQLVYKGSYLGTCLLTMLLLLFWNQTHIHLLSLTLSW